MQKNNNNNNNNNNNVMGNDNFSVRQPANQLSDTYDMFMS